VNNKNKTHLHLPSPPLPDFFKKKKESDERLRVNNKNKTHFTFLPPRPPIPPKGGTGGWGMKDNFFI